MKRFPLRQLSEIIETVSVRGHQVKTEAYEDGEGWPIVDQGNNLICGYTNRADPIDCELPVTVFGDHTRETKFIDFPFVAGADGTKVLRGAGVEPRYFHALIEMASERITNLGYSRHFKLINEFDAPYTDDFGEQKRIASVLKAWDGAIATVDTLVKAKERRSASLANKLLARCFNPPGDSGWASHQLGELFHERDERAPSSPLLSITAGRGVIPRDDVERKDTSAADKSNYKSIRKGDIGYNTMRMWQGVSALSGLNGIVSPAYTIVIPNDKIRGDFAALLFKQPRMIYQFWRYSQGLVDDTLSLKFPHFAEIRVAIPDYSTQSDIANVISAASNDTKAIRQTAELLRQQRRGLTEKLLSGELQAPDSIGPNPSHIGASGLAVGAPK